MTYTVEEAFDGRQVNGAAFSGVGCQVYFTSTNPIDTFFRNYLYTWSLTSPDNEPEFVGPIVDANSGAIVNGDGVAFSGGDLYVSSNGRGLYKVDPSLDAELVVPYFVSMGGIASDSSTANIYGLDDNGLRIVQFDLESASLMTIASYPGVTDIDGLAAGDGKLYLVTDRPGDIYVYDLEKQEYDDAIESPFGRFEKFSGAAYITGSGLGEN